MHTLHTNLYETLLKMTSSNFLSTRVSNFFLYNEIANVKMSSAMPIPFVFELIWYKGQHLMHHLHTF